MNRTLQGVVFAFLILCIVVLFLSIIPVKDLSTPTATPTPKPEDTATPTSTNTFFIAHINIDSPCSLGTNKEYEVITTIPQGRDVMVIGKDSDQADWLLVRWGGFSDCWIERRFVTSYDVDLLDIVPAAPLPTFTTTSNPTQTFTPTKTEVVVAYTPIRRTSDNPTRIQPLTNIPDPANTPGPTNTPKPPPTNAPKPPPTNTPCLNPQGKPVPCHP
jgi:hypothetical protein